MNLFDEIKKLADEHGKIPLEKLNELKESLPTEKFDQLKELADKNGDNAINLDDLKNFNFGDILSSAQDMLGGLFGKK